MGKSVVLKDLSSHPAGYLRETEGGMLCRAYASEPAEAVVVFADGSQSVYTIEPGGREQFFSCEGKRIACAYVFRDEALLMITDETARAAFAQSKCRIQKSVEAPMGRKEFVCALQYEKEKQQKSVCDALRLPERRWPPPACWPLARYRQGSWGE